MGDSALVGRDGRSPQFDVFISYAIADRDVVTPFVNALKRDGFSVWIDYEQMAGGVPVLDQLADAIAESAHMIVCITDTYLRREWTKYELDISVVRNPSGREARTIPVIFRPLTVEKPAALTRLTICDLTDVREYEQQYERATKMIRRQVTSIAPGAAEIGQVCAAPFDHADHPERALFEAYQAYRELCLFLYRREFGGIPAQASFRWLTDKLVRMPDLPPEIRDALAAMEGYGGQVVPGHVDSPPVTKETIARVLQTLATLTEWAFPEWRRPDERVDVWKDLPQYDDVRRQLPGTDYVLSAPPLGRTTLGPLYPAEDTSRNKPMTVALIESPPDDDHAFRRHMAQFEHLSRGGVLVVGDVGEFVVNNGRQHYVTLPEIDDLGAESLIELAGSLPPRATYELVLGIAEVVRGLHEADPGVVHGDIALANVFVGSLGTVVLCPGRPVANTRADDLKSLAKVLDGLLPGPVAEQLMSCTTAVRACQILRNACRGLPAEDSLSSVYRPYRKDTTPAPGSARPGRGTQLVGTCRIESQAAWPMCNGRLLVWEKGTNTLVVREGEETVWRDTCPVAVRRVAYGPEGRLAIGGWDGAVRCLVDGAPVVTATMVGAIGDLCFVGDSLVAGSWKQGLVRFAPDGQPHELLDVKAGVHRIAVADTGDRFAVADLSGGLAIYADNRRVQDLPTVGFVTDLAYAGTRLVLLTGEALSSLRLDGSTGVSEARPGARRLLPGSAPGKCTLLVETATGAETWVIDEADRHVRDHVFPAGRTLVATCAVPGRFIVSDADGGYAYWRDGEQQAQWRNASTVTIARDGRLVVVSKPGVVELYEDFA